jgi:hypothetical protein
MSSLPAMIAPVREFFTLARAEKTARAYAPPQQARIREYFDAAERRLSAGRRLEQSVPSAALLRDALVCYLLAAEIARDRDARVDSLTNDDLVAAMPELLPDPSRLDTQPSDDARVRAALGATDLLYFDRFSPEDVARVRWALDRAASVLRKRVEVRSVTNIRGARWGRFAALALVLLYAALARVSAATLPNNLALHKPVTPSSVWYPPPAGQTIVDGDIGQSFGIHTQIEDSANVVIDLLEVYKIKEVRVHNRVDGWFDDGLPFVAELSTDGKTFTEIGRREDHFEGDPPWIVDAHGQLARYVRIRVARKTYLALSEVEVFGKKK